MWYGAGRVQNLTRLYQSNSIRMLMDEPGFESHPAFFFHWVPRSNVLAASSWVCNRW
jgi:hypothetical protein